MSCRRILVLCLVLVGGCSARPVVLMRAHAHNDYQHPRPLLDALEHGFASVEVDVHLVSGRLLVGHDVEDVVADRTLERLYLEPLRQRVAGNNGRVYRNGPTLTLLIDVKSEAEPTYAVLRRMLARYAPMLTHFTDDRVVPGAVTVIISGHRARDVMRAEETRCAAYDGRIEDLVGTNSSSSLMPLISSPWVELFTWDGNGEMPAGERKKLRMLVERVHAHGRRLRLWGAPDCPSGWGELYAAGVDLINTDNLAGLRAFLLAQSGKP